jgi:hypothetical protein
MAADQPEEFLRMYLMAVRIGNILQRHRAALGDHVFFLREFSGKRAGIGR